MVAITVIAVAVAAVLNSKGTQRLAKKENTTIWRREMKQVTENSYLSPQT